MRRAWRISAWPGLSGAGGLLQSARWHSKGRRVLYLGEHPALALIEVMANMRLSPSAIPLTLKLIAIDIKDGALEATVPDLPTGWQANEPGSRALGDAWLDSGSGLMMAVPSAIIAHATNYLVNTAHPQAATHLVEASIESFWFDSHFFR